MGRLQRSHWMVISTIGVIAILPILQVLGDTGNDGKSILTGPSTLISTTPASTRFSRLLQDNAASLQFSSISNAAPPLSGLSKEFQELKQKSHKKKTQGSRGRSISSTNLGRRTLDYDASESFYENGEPIPKIITQPQPGNEYVYIRQGGIQTEEQQVAAASVTSINKQPISNRVPLTLLRQSNGKTVNIRPVFAERKIELQNDAEEENKTTISQMEIDTTTIPFNMEKQTEDSEPQMIVNVVTSVPRSEVDGQSTTPKIDQDKDSIVNPTPFLTVESSNVVARNSSKQIDQSEDAKENLVIQSTSRIGNFPDFEDSPASLQTSESSSQPARVNVRPAQSGKEYEYEYIYYYYDDDEEANGTAKLQNGTKGVKQTSLKGSEGSNSTTKSAVINEETDFVDEDEIKYQEVNQAPKKTSSVPVRTTSAPVETKNPIKPSNTNIVNQLDRSRDPKRISQQKVTVPEADYKLEQGDFDEGYEYEDDIVQVKAKGQPQRAQSQSDEDDTIEEQEAPSQSHSTTAPAISSTLSGSDGRSTMAKSHPDSVNNPIVLKQSSILQSVPASRLQSNFAPESRPTSPITPPTSTTTTIEAASETIPSASVRPSGSRFRGQQRIRGGSNNETPSTSAPAQEEQVSSQRPSFQRTQNRRTSTKRPQAPESIVETPEAHSSVSQTPVRSRFPLRTTSSQPTSERSTSSPSTEATIVNEPSSSVRVNDATQSDSYVRSKSANDLYTFSRLQQAISSRAPGRLVAGRGSILKPNGLSSSAEQSTDTTSSEVTTFPADIGNSNEQQIPVQTTTTTTTTEAPSTEAAGKTRARFGGGRPRRPLGGSSSNGASSSQPDVSTTPRAPTRSRFGGRRQPSTSASITNTAEETSPSVATPTTSSEPIKPRVPARNRFTNRNRNITLNTETKSEIPAEKQEAPASESVPSTASPSARRKPIFQGRRRNPNGVSSTATPSDPSEIASEASLAVEASPSPYQTETDSDRRRPGLPTVQRRRPGIGPRIRGGRLGGSSTTEVPVEQENLASDKQEAEQSPTNQSEQVEPAVSSSIVPAPVTGNNRGSTGVVGRLRTRPNKLVTTTTTVAPEPISRDRPSRLNGILNRRKPGVAAPSITTASPVKEESKEEDAQNNAQEQVDSQHKGVVVQVSSSVTESEETKDTGEEIAETPSSSTTPGSILNRLKSQRKSGTIFRKRTDPHGE